MTALFLVIVVEQWQEQRSHFAAITGAICGIIWLLLLGPDRFILPALCSCVVILLAVRGSVEGRTTKQKEEVAG